MTDHPRDEFDEVPEASERQGAHREHLVPTRPGGIGVKIGAASVALLIGLGSYFLLPRLVGPGETDAAGPDTSVSTGTDAPAPATDPATDPGTAEPGVLDDGVDREQTVNVLNGTGVPGLASVAVGRLADAGWGSAQPGNWVGAPLDASVIFYDGENQRATAEALAADLGITGLLDSSEISADVSVVLGPEFE